MDRRVAEYMRKGMTDWRVEACMDGQLRGQMDEQMGR